VAALRQYRAFLVLVVFVSVLSVTSCGGSEPATSPNNPQNATGHAQPVGAAPSAAAKMVCAHEAQADLAAVLGVHTTQPVVPTWTDHIYSCRYTYHNAVMVLSVKELSSKNETDGYFTSLKHRLGQAQDLGESAFTTKNRSVVVRKDYKVLLVDISGLPGRFGDPPFSRGRIAIKVAATIMNCWTGA
jgi:hypothetical protein